MNKNLLKAEMIRNGLNGQGLAKQIGISESAFYRKLSGVSEFTRDEILAIKDALNLTGETILSIFFGPKVS